MKHHGGPTTRSAAFGFTRVVSGDGDGRSIVDLKGRTFALFPAVGRLGLALNDRLSKVGRRVKEPFWCIKLRLRADLPLDGPRGHRQQPRLHRGLGDPFLGPLKVGDPRRQLGHYHRPLTVSPLLLSQELGPILARLSGRRGGAALLALARQVSAIGEEQM